MAFEWQKKPFFRKLLDALWYDAEEYGTYAAGGKIASPSQRGPLLDSIEVDGVGTIQLPLSADDCLKLVNVCEQAPYGKGLATVVDTSVRHAWQVDASYVTFPGDPQFLTKTIQLLANKAVCALGLFGDALQLEVKLYKLLLYEPGGHFSLHRDTEKELGMFATLVLQLPTQGGFEGGALVVRHSNDIKTFDFSKDSSMGFFYTVFFADCEHELQNVASGTRLCLAFNLVRGSNSFGMPLEELKGFSQRILEVKASLRPWLEAVTAQDLQGPLDEDLLDEDLPNKLAIPLQHKYTKKNLSFARLKGKDQIIVEVLKCCKDLELHLCILTKHQTGEPSHTGYDHYRYRRRYDDDDEDDDDNDQHTMEEVHEEEVESANWVGINDKICSFTLDIDQDTEVVFDEDDEDDLFDNDGEPDEVEYEGHTGNAGPTLEYWYHKAMIVIWPKKNTFSIALESGLSAVLDVLESRLAKKDPDFATLLHETLTYCKKNSGEISSQNQVPGRLLELCLGGGTLEDVLCILRLLTSSVGIGNAKTATTIARAVQKHGWDKCRTDVMSFLKQDHVALHGKFFGQLASELLDSGCQVGAILVAKRTLDLVGKMLAANKKPVFSWCMPLAKFPRHPRVEAFLRGPEETLTYEGVNDLNHAINFARKYFTGRYQDGYSGIGRAGEGRFRARCVITKTRAAFQHLVLSSGKEQEELMLLRTKLGNLQTASTRNTGRNRTEVVIVSPESSPHQDKRMKVGNTEYIDLSLEDDINSHRAISGCR